VSITWRLVLKKKDATEEHFWPRLLKEKAKVSEK
jgi:hypothetical protein